ncbi:MAG: acyl carrier protein [Marinilabiliaceae bacterium]|nr:acyl carrier protein [Marinilabiliaceae bacterium]
MFEATLKEVIEIASTVFKTPVEDLSGLTTSDNVESWDSMGHASFIANLEKHFNIKFTIIELVMLSSLDEIAKNIESKLHAN